MNKEIIKKWVKKVGIAIGSVIAIFLLYVVFAYVRFYWYIPYQCDSLYQNGLTNESQAANSITKLLVIDSDIAHDKAIQLLTVYAEKGNIKYQIMLGDVLTKDSYYCMRNKANECKDKAAYWYLQAAKTGNAEAQGKIGMAYKYGKGVIQNFNKAIFWLKNGAEKGDTLAQYNLGNIYINGLAYYSIHNLGRTENYIYDGNGTFVSLDNNYTASNSEVYDILNYPDSVFLVPNIKIAKYYWTLSANQGCKSAKDALEKIYE